MAAFKKEIKTNCIRYRAGRARGSAGEEDTPQAAGLNLFTAVGVAGGSRGLPALGWIGSGVRRARAWAGQREAFLLHKINYFSFRPYP